MLSARLYADLNADQVIPIIRNNPTNPPSLPAFLGGRRWLDFRNTASYEVAYEELLRDIHRTAVDVAPPLGPNPFEGKTEVEARLGIRNSSSRWHSPGLVGEVEFAYSQNSGHYKIGTGTTQFTLDIGERGMGTVYVLRDPSDIANVAIINRVQGRKELLTDVSQFDTSSRIVDARVGDAVVLHNRNGFWALVFVTAIYAREALNRELVIEFRYAIQSNRTADLSGFEIC
jgi:hypothetical protein